MNILENSLTAARALVQEERQEGVVCPCCGLFAKVYRRRVSSSIARSLIALHRLDCQSSEHLFHHVSEFDRNKSRGEFARMRFWGLIEERSMNQGGKSALFAEKRTSGYWRLLQPGVDFVNGNKKVPKYLYLYGGKPIHVEDNEPHLSVHECLGQRFNYAQLMASP